MAITESRGTRYNLMDNAQLIHELHNLVTYTPMTADAAKLLAAVSRRLVLKETESRTPASSAARSNTRVCGIDLSAACDDEASAAVRLKNLIKDMVYAAEGDPTHRDIAFNSILRSIELRIQPESYAKGQVYVELQQQLELNCWRVMVDIPHPETKGMLVRHYITNTNYYAFPITFVKLDPKIEAVPYVLMPPTWTMSEVFAETVVNFDTKTIYHSFSVTNNDDGLGVYVCDMDGTVRMRHGPGNVPREVRNAFSF